MNRRLVLCTVLLMTAFSARAQFLGDAMAAAGFAESEDVGRDALASLAYGRQPRPSQNVSTPQWSPTNPEPGAQPRTQPQLSTVPPTTSTEPIDWPGPDHAPSPTYPIAGSGKTYTPEEAAAWKAAFLPVGASVSGPPAGSEAVTGSWGTYQYSKGVFYKPDGKQWIVVPAPVGARVKDRPAAASMIVYRNVPYLYYNGAFYVWNVNAKAADVVAPPAGAIVTYIPETAVKQDRNGQTCYVYGETCFRPSFRGSNVVYVVG